MMLSNEAGLFPLINFLVFSLLYRSSSCPPVYYCNDIFQHLLRLVLFFLYDFLSELDKSFV